ncbi:MAG: DNA-directed RNA polymerase subunit beta [Mollicutes bacterium]|nr:DNA-directed RNA polymerase subunit beta [Mollicutes bacterium]
MSYKLKKFGDYRERVDFSKVENIVKMEDLLEIQTKSYQWFITEGIKEVFHDFFPVEGCSGTLSLDFGEFHFEKPRHSKKDSKDREATYAAPLKVEARLLNNETGEVKEQEVFLGDIPLMTENGTFIINGAERVIVSQLLRSPSVYFKKEIDKNGKSVFSSELIPTRGTWLEYETDARDILHVRIDRSRKVYITTFLRALGLSSDENILELFGDNEYIKNTLTKDMTKNKEEALIEIYERLRPGEPATLDSAKNQLIVKFFDELRYDLAKVGRYKFNKKLDICDRLLNTTLAEDIKEGKKVIVEKGTLITREILDQIKPLLHSGYGTTEVKINEDLDTHNKVQTILVYSKVDSTKPIKIIGVNINEDCKRLTIADIYASISYYLNLLDGIGKIDEIDHLANRRIRQVGELLQNQFRIGISRVERVIRERMTTIDLTTATPKTLINIRPVTAILKEFFGSSQLSQFMDQVNPMSEMTNKRRLSALGPGGLSRDRAGMEVRDVNASHYGRICPVESPEGPNIGLITSLAGYAKINDYGFIMTPYRKVENKKITDKIEYFTADEEYDYVIVSATVKINENNEIIEDNITARYQDEVISTNAEAVNYVDVSPQQIISVITSCIPFLEHDDANRALMGANMQRQALPLLQPEAPIVATGTESVAAIDSGAVIISKVDGIVDYVDGKKIVINTKDGKVTYTLANFERSNSATCYHQRPIVKIGDKINKGQIITDGPSVDKGEISVGRNVVVAFMTFNGYNYEDAIILNEQLVLDDAYTSIKIESYDIECRDTKLGPEEITRDIPNVSEEARKNLDIDGIVRVGTEVKEGDILVGKVTPKGMVELTSEEKLLHAIFGEKTREVRDTSLRVAHGADGIVSDIKVYTKKENEDIPSGVLKTVKIFIAQKRKIGVGDKMAGRHGNKGVISLVLPKEDMPYLPDGTPVDILLNPLGVPSRMNLGQVLELHLGMAAKKLGLHVATPAFDGAKYEEIEAMMEKAKMSPDGKADLYDGKTGEKFDGKISVGVMYMIKLMHMVDDKLHARSTGPYSLVTQQPLGGKAQFGGQRFGEMEVWALYAYGAANVLQEILTVKSDDVVGRVKVYEAIVKGKEIHQAGIPESFKVLIKEFQALGLDISIINDKFEEVELKQLEDEDNKTTQMLSIEEIEDIDEKSNRNNNVFEDGEGEK